MLWSHCYRDLSIRNFVLFDQAVSEDRCHGTMKKVQDPKVLALVPCPKFIDAIAQVVRLRPTQLVAEISKPFDLHPTFVLYLWRKRVQLFQDRNFAVFFLVKDNLSFRHVPPR